MKVRGFALAALAALPLIGACAETSEDEAPAAAPDPMGGEEAFLEGPELWLASLEYSEVGVPRLGDGRNVTDRAGYDNQPRFLPDGSILYTRGVADRTDIWRYDPATDTHAAVTSSADQSEYSATPTPDGGFSGIVVEPDSMQRLWRFDLDGSNGGPLFEDVAPVGYHAWMDGERIGMFVLGDPATLQLGTAGASGPAEELDRGIGRSLNTIPGTRAISYPVSVGEYWEIRALVGEDTEVLTAPLVRIPAQDHAWTPRGRILYGDGHRLMAVGPLAVPLAAGDTDTLINDAPYVIGELPDPSMVISRLAVSDDGASIVLVVDRPTN